MLRVIIFITCFGLTFFSCNKVRQKKTIKRQKEKLKKKRVHKKFTIPWDNFYLGNDKSGNDKSGISLSALDTISIFDTILYNNDKLIRKSSINSNDPYLKEYRKCDRSSELYYYSVLDTVNYYSVVVFIHGEYHKDFTLVNYSKKFKYIDDVNLCSRGQEYTYDIKFLNDSIFLRKDIYFDTYEEPDKSNEQIVTIKDRMMKKWVIKLKLLKNGVIEVDTINRNDWYSNDWYSND